MEHCRCHIVYVNKTRAERIAYTVEFPPEHNKIPGISNQEAATDAELGLIDSISNPALTALYISIRSEKIQAVIKLADIFKQKTTPQKYPQRDTSQTRVDVKHRNTPKTTATPRVKPPIKRQNPAPIYKQNSKPTPIVAYEKYKYTTHRGTPS